MEQYEKIQQLLKKEPGTKERVPIFPPTVIQAVFDAKTGASLEAILAQFNSITVQYQGSPRDTRLAIPMEMRRPGLTITYTTVEGDTLTERANSQVTQDDNWALDTNWSRIDELSLSGDIAVSARGTWIINGKDTGIKAVGPKGENGITPWLKEIDNKLHYSYDNVKWTGCSGPLSAQFRNHNNRIQISYDKGKTWTDISDPVATYVRFAATSSTSQDGSIGKLQYSYDKATWHDLSPEFRNYLRIQGYVATNDKLPTGVPVGTIYGVGPTYAVGDTSSSNPMYQLFVWDGTQWVHNGRFNSIAAGIVQETGDSETEVMSQKAVSEKLSELGSEIMTKQELKKASVYRTTNGYQNSRYNGVAVKVANGWIKSYRNLKKVAIVGQYYTTQNDISVINYASGGTEGALTGVTNVTFNSKVNEAGKIAVVVDIPEGNILYISGYDGYELDVYDLDYYENQVTNLNEKINSNYEEFSSKIRMLDIKDILNGTKITYAKNKDMNGVTDVTENTFTYKYSGTGNKWAYSKIFTPKGSNLVHVKAKVNLIKEGNPTGLIVLVSDSTTVNGKRTNIGYITDAGEQTIDMVFDPANLTVYQGFNQFSIWINNISMQSGDSIEAIFTDFEIYEIDNAKEYENINGGNVSELFESVDNAIKSTSNQNANILVSPNGEKFYTAIDDYGNIIGVRLFPQKAHFFGNSLLSGFGYGMAASGTTKDYYYLLNSFFKQINTNYSAKKTGASGLERLEESQIESSIKWAIDFLSGDEDLVVVQLGDNVNNDNIFTVVASKFLKAIRLKCPRARVIWMGMWYSTESKYTIIKDACKNTGCDFLSFSGIANSSTRNSIGSVYRHENLKENIVIENILDVTEHTPNNITITFDVGGKSYTTTIDVVSYDLSNNILTYSGYYGIITSSGVASHPNDLGFKRISNRFLYELGYSDDENYFE